MGVETLSSYGIGSPVAVTPVLDQLAAQGMRFENFWAAPTCTPTRAHIASGRYGFRTGVTSPIFSHAHLLDTTENPIPPPVGSHKELMFSAAGPKPHLGSIEMALGSTVDLYATIIELVGGDIRSAIGDERVVDSRSLAGIIRNEPGADLREYIYTESLFGPAPAWAIRDARYKLVRIKRRKGIAEEFYDLYSDPYEQNDLVGKLLADQGEAYRKLARQLDTILN